MILKSKALLMIVIFIVGIATGILITSELPVRISGLRKLTVVVVDGGQMTIGTAQTSALIHYSDGTNQNVTGNSLTLSPIFQSGVTLAKGKIPTTADFAATIFYVPNFDVSKYCLTGPLGNKLCAQDAILTVETDIAITVNGQVVYQSPSNGKYLAYSSTGKLNNLANLIGTLGGYVVPTFQAGQMSVPFSLTGWDISPYRQANQSITVALSGTQIYNIYPIYFYAGGEIRADTDHPIIDPYTITYSDPTFTIPSTQITTPDYALSISPQSITVSTNAVNNGNLGYVKVAAQAYNGLTGTFNIGQVQGLSNGLTYQFQTPNNPQVTTTTTLVGVQLVFAATSTLTPGSYSVTIPSSIGSVSHSVTLSITVTNQTQTCPSGATCGKILTQLQATGPITVSALFPISITGKLTTSSGGGVKGEVIYAQSSFSSTQGTTASDGSFAIIMFAPSTTGAYDIGLTFAGDSQYASSGPVNVRVAVTAFDYMTAILIAVIVIVVILVIVALATRGKSARSVTYTTPPARRS